MGGVAGYKVNSAEKFSPSGNRSGASWSQAEGYTKPKCFTLWQGYPDSQESKPLTRLTDPQMVFPGDSNKVNFTTNRYLLESLELNGVSHLKKIYLELVGSFP